ncbi:hypothetical protein E2C01_045600 [Portunus trituberculatus]|uniref:Uncharacterized protein n=1 Tax=Portunus trituberculatus TaxID=210409 RepID=A0A5B7G2G5_PORTR|nr:hypothetical protein [Portunus trituberculatus]
MFAYLRSIIQVQYSSLINSSFILKWRICKIAVKRLSAAGSGQFDAARTGTSPPSIYLTLQFADTHKHTL